MKSIKAKLITGFGLLLAVICVGFGVISYLTSSTALKSNLDKTLSQIALEGAHNVEGRVSGQLNTLHSLSLNKTLTDPDIPWETKSAVLIEEAKRNGNIKMGIADKDGNTKFTDENHTNVAEREYFKKALLGQNNVTDPLVSKTDGAVLLVYAVPLKHNNEIVGVLISARDGNRLSDLTDAIKFGETGRAYMLSKGGTTIAHSNRDLVLDMNNYFENVKTDKSLQGLVDIQKKMVDGEKGTGEYTYNGVSRYVAYAPLKSTGWSLAVAIEEKEVLAELNTLRIYILLSSVLFLLLGLGVALFISNKISKGIKAASSHLKLLAKGDLSTEVSANILGLKDEVGEMAHSMQTMQSSLVDIVRSIKENSSNINNETSNLAAIAEEMASSSDNVANSIQDVANGAGSQAEDLITITNVLNQFGNQLEQIVSSIQEVEVNSKSIDGMAQDSNSNMQTLVESVTKVSDLFTAFTEKITVLGSSINKINEITTLINSIADQTNLLALNAAIEAARAGESGRGFAVVADEIRKLAEQSKTSSENISALITTISQETKTIVSNTDIMNSEIGSQVQLIDITIESFKKIISGIGETSPMIAAINTNAVSINQEKNNILEKVEGTSSVAEEVSASSEEIAAASQQMNASTEEVASAAHLLSDMAKDMLEQVNKFKL
jgi:methyl-accepting chemotaxis protein